MQAQERKTAQRDQSLDVISVKRNPYLVDYEEQRRLQRAVNEGPCRQPRSAQAGRGQNSAAAKKAAIKRRRTAVILNSRRTCTRPASAPTLS